MKKATYIILGLVVVLGLIYAFTRRDKISVNVKHVSLPTFNTANVTEIDISGKDKIKLSKVGDRWMAQIGETAKKVDANPGHVEQLLEAASELNFAYFVSEQPDMQKEFGLNADEATLITIKGDDKPLWSL